MEKTEGQDDEVDETCAAEELVTQRREVDSPPNDDHVFVSVPLSRLVFASCNEAIDYVLTHQQRTAASEDGNTSTLASNASKVDFFVDAGRNAASIKESVSGLRALIKDTSSVLDEVFGNWPEIHVFTNEVKDIHRRFREGNPGAMAANAFDLLCEFEQTLEIARADPSTLPVPANWDVPHETSLQCHPGFNAAANYFSKSIIDKLATLSTNCAVCKSTIQQVSETCRRVESFLEACLKIASDMLQTCQSLGQRFEDVMQISMHAPHDRKSVPFKSCSCAFVLWMSGVNMIEFDASIQSWLDLSARLEVAIPRIRQGADAVDEFLGIASQEIVEAFQRPYLTSLIQSIFIGEKHPLMHALLKPIDALSACNFRQIIVAMQELTSAHWSLPLDAVRESFQARILDASICFDALHTKLHECGCATNVRIEMHGNGANTGLVELGPNLGNVNTKLQISFHDGHASPLQNLQSRRPARKLIEEKASFEKDASKQYSAVVTAKARERVPSASSQASQDSI